VSPGIPARAIDYNIGSKRAEAQSGTPESAGIAIDFAGQAAFAITTTGDVYARPSGFSPSCDGTWGGCSWVLTGKVVSGPVPVEGSSFGGIKGAYR
jgi:hypothetical protein